MSSASSFACGTEFAVVGQHYQVDVPMGLKPTQWLNKLTKAAWQLGEVVFEAEGCLRRPSESKPLLIGSMSTRWSWEAVPGRFVINFFHKDRLVHRHWHELWPVAGDVSELTGIGHVGSREFHYSMVSCATSVVSDGSQYSHCMRSPVSSSSCLLTLYGLACDALADADSSLAEADKEQLLRSPCATLRTDSAEAFQCSPFVFGACLCVGSCCCLIDEEDKATPQLPSDEVNSSRLSCPGSPLSRSNLRTHEEEFSQLEASIWSYCDQGWLPKECMQPQATNHEQVGKTKGQQRQVSFETASTQAGSDDSSIGDITVRSAWSSWSSGFGNPAPRIFESPPKDQRDGCGVRKAKPRTRKRNAEAPMLAVNRDSLFFF